MSRNAVPMLKVEGITKNFGGFRALDGVSFHLNEGEVLGLVGPNGSGKTTCINTISGIYGIDSGTITFRNQQLGRYAPHVVTRLGINRTYQSPRPFSSLTVNENVVVAASDPLVLSGLADGASIATMADASSNKVRADAPWSRTWTQSTPLAAAASTAASRLARSRRGSVTR